MEGQAQERNNLWDNNFAAALAYVAQFGSTFSNRDRRVLDAIEMQALLGNHDDNEIDLNVEDYQIQGWKQLKNQTKQACQKVYFERVSALSQAFDPKITLSDHNPETILQDALRKAKGVLKQKKFKPGRKTDIGEKMVQRPVVTRPNVSENFEQRHTNMKNRSKSKRNVRNTKGGKGKGRNKKVEPKPETYPLYGAFHEDEEIVIRDSDELDEKPRGNSMLDRFKEKAGVNNYRERLKSADSKKSLKESKEEEKDLEDDVTEAMYRISRNENVLRGSILETGMRTLRTQTEEEMEKVLETDHQKELKKASDEEKTRIFETRQAFKSRQFRPRKPQMKEKSEIILNVQPVEEDEEEKDDEMGKLMPLPEQKKESSFYEKLNNLKPKVFIKKENQQPKKLTEKDIETLVMRFYKKHNAKKLDSGIDHIVKYALKKGVPKLNERLKKQYGEGLDEIQAEMQNEKERKSDDFLDDFLSEQNMKKETKIESRRNVPHNDTRMDVEVTKARRFKKKLVEFLLKVEPDRVDKCLYLMTRFKDKNGIVRLNRKLEKLYGYALDITDLTSDNDMYDLRREFEDIEDQVKRSTQGNLQRVERSGPLKELTKKDAEMLSLYFAKHDTSVLNGDYMQRLHSWTDVNGVASLNRRLKRRYDEDLDEFIFATDKLSHELSEFYSMVDPKKLKKGFDVILRWGVIHGRTELNKQLDQRYQVTLDSSSKALRSKSSSFIDF